MSCLAFFSVLWFLGFTIASVLSLVSCGSWDSLGLPLVLPCVFPLFVSFCHLLALGYSLLLSLVLCCLLVCLVSVSYLGLSYTLSIAFSPEIASLVFWPGFCLAFPSFVSCESWSCSGLSHGWPHVLASVTWLLSPHLASAPAVILSHVISSNVLFFHLSCPVHMSRFLLLWSISFLGFALLLLIANDDLKSLGLLKRLFLIIHSSGGGRQKKRLEIAMLHLSLMASH